MKQKYKPENITSPKLVSGQTGWVWAQGDIRIATVSTVGNNGIIVLVHINSKTAIAAIIQPSKFLAKDY